MRVKKSSVENVEKKLQASTCAMLLLKCCSLVGHAQAAEIEIGSIRNYRP